MEQSLLRRPGRIGSLVLQHRILMGAMHLGIEGDWKMLPQLIAFYEERVRGGAALIMTGNAAVLPEGGGQGMFCLTEPDHLLQLEELAASIRKVGGLLALQLAHRGRYATRAETGLAPLAPSPIPSRLTKEIPEEMTREDIDRLKEAFADSAFFAASAGFAAIEIMGSEGYLLNEFMSPLMNRRTDEYGGDSVARMRLCLEIVEGIRERVGREFPIIYRMSGDDCMEGSTTREETLDFARKLERSGVDALNVGIGWHESSIPTVGAIVPAGAYAHVAASLKTVVSIPIIGANRIHTPEMAEQVIVRGDMDFVAPARPWLADPSFARKIAEADREGLNLCVSCNQACLDHTLGHPPKPVGCLVNPRTGRESFGITLSDNTLAVAVVGGGVAGLQAAKTAAERGHSVTLYEAENRLGGQFLLASRIPGKEVFRETIRYFQVALQRLGVTLRMNTAPSADELKKYDRVIIATGVKPYVSEALEGAELPHVCTYADILSGARPFGRKIVIVGGGGIGCDVAHYIAEQMRLRPEVEAFFAERGYAAKKPTEASITIVSRSEKVAKGVGPTSRWVLLSELKRRSVQMMKGFHASSITTDGVWLESGEDKQFLPADQIVLCTGQEPRVVMSSDELKGLPDIEWVGGVSDATELNAAKAIRQAYEISCTI
ncbi:2,4-dienoyl-CoA reductase (NADPH2) [Paenibacillus sp. yr247]|uniref:FAD-dependent oxidoreductase n=1 Tax=Paenibacillus sp. yr247 TaxID=1761880 RepID=UPI00088FC18E|nr:FAD-dependent oxidoreductase [Paenibacillus sp. yr247]SDO40314.1 2,4-dienoyl-CoA reductase (NADPH2) [Paenibacillus sp. yr247]